MQKYFTFIFSLLIACTFTSCTEIIDIDLPTAEPRLVVEGNLDFDSNNSTHNVYVKLSLTTDYFNPEIPQVDNATVWIEDKNNIQYQLNQIDNSGIYFTNSIALPDDGDAFTLTVNYDGDIYEAKEIFRASPVIEKLEQRREKFFDTVHYTLRIYYQDVPNNSDLLNYYFMLTKGYANRPQLRVLSNEFSKGRLMESLYISDENTTPGDTININLSKVSRNYYDYMYTLIGAIGNGGGPYEVPTGKVIGNIKNLTTPEKEALGYFRVTQDQNAQHIVFEQPLP